MKEKLLHFLPYIVAALVAIILIVTDVVSTNNKASQEELKAEEYARSVVEASEILLDGHLYRGVYDREEVASIPDDYEYVGTIKEMVDDGVELTENLTSHILPDGYDIYASKNLVDLIYVDISYGEEYKSYIPYILFE